MKKQEAPIHNRIRMIPGPADSQLPDRGMAVIVQVKHWPLTPHTTAYSVINAVDTSHMDHLVVNTVGYPRPLLVKELSRMDLTRSQGSCYNRSLR